MVMVGEARAASDLDERHHVVVTRRRFSTNELTADALMVAFGAMVGGELCEQAAKMSLPGDHEMVQTVGPYRSHHPFGVRVAVRALRGNRPEFLGSCLPARSCSLHQRAYCLGTETITFAVTNTAVETGSPTGTVKFSVNYTAQGAVLDIAYDLFPDIINISISITSPAVILNFVQSVGLTPVVNLQGTP